MSLLILGLGWYGARGLEEADQKLRGQLAEEVAVATDLARISIDLIRYHTTVILASEEPTQTEFLRLSASLPEQRAYIHQALDRYATSGLRKLASYPDESQDLEAVRQSLEAYFSAAGGTLSLLNRVWEDPFPDGAQAIRTKAKLNAADIAWPEFTAVSVALDQLLERVAQAARKERRKRADTTSLRSVTLMVSSLTLSLLNLFITRSRFGKGSLGPVGLVSGMPNDRRTFRSGS